MEPQTILAVEVNDFKKLSVFKATLERTGLTIITGDNGAGKSSAIDALVAAITGEKPEVPIRRGAAKAKIIVKTPDLIITRKFTPAGSYLEVTDHDGRSVATSSQTALQVLTKGRTPVMFDASEFALMKPAERTTQLLTVCPVDLDLFKNAADRKKSFDERTAVNRDVKRIEGLLASLPKPPETPPERVDVVKLTETLEGLRERERGYQKKRQELKEAQRTLTDYQDKFKQLDLLIVELQKKLDAAKIEWEATGIAMRGAAAAVVGISKTVEAIPDLKPEGLAIVDQIKRAEQVNAAVEECRQQAQAIASATGELADAQKLAGGLTGVIGALDAARETAIKFAHFPHPGLSIDDQGSIQLDGLPFDQACTSQQYIVGIALAAAAQPTVRVAFIRHGGNLDTNNLAVVDAYGREHGIQIIAEIVQSQTPGAIRIVDGASV